METNSHQVLGDQWDGFTRGKRKPWKQIHAELLNTMETNPHDAEEDSTQVQKFDGSGGEMPSGKCDGRQRGVNSHI